MGNANDFTQLIQQVRQGDSSSRDELFRKMTQELKVAAESRQDLPNPTGQPSALINEAVMRMLAGTVLQSPKDKLHVLKAANRALKRVLLEHASLRRPIGIQAAALRSPMDMILETLESRDNTTIFELTGALESLRQSSERQADCIELTFFSGLGEEDIAQILEIDGVLVRRELALAKAKLASSLRSTMKAGAGGKE